MMVRSCTILAALLALAGCASVPPATPSAALQHRAGVVEAADPRAAAAGRAMLELGGSSTDAAIATMLALTVVEPQSSGIGGGGFFVRGSPDGTAVTIDGRETAPRAAGPDWFLDEAGNPRPRNEVTPTGLSIGVPGNIALAAEAHRRFGQLEWAQLFGPAIALAQDGFVMNPRLFESLTGAIEDAGYDPALRRVFYTDAGEPRPVGSLIRRPELAATFRALAAQGPQAMYGPEAAAALAAHVAAHTPGDVAMSAQDITSYEAPGREALCGRYRGYRICGMGPPSSGAQVVIGILGQLEPYDLAALGPESVQFWHLFVEAQKLAYADREYYIGDPDFVGVPANELVATDYLHQRSTLIDPARANPAPPPGDPLGLREARADGDEPADEGTSHLVAVDPDGTMVSYTSTVEGGFGAGIAFGGYHLNNELTDFSFSPEADGVPVANAVAGGKRPRSSMSPMVIWDPEGEPFLAIGGGGGLFIPVEVTRSIIGVIDFDMGLQDALGLPLVMGFGSSLYLEEGTWPAAHVAELEALGHGPFRIGPQPFGSVGTTAALATPSGWVTAFDPRFIGRLEAPQ